ncbi:MAG: hypothetical protein ACI8WB_004993 [Phenylobacterium sp.]|jgi:hypothetical protein
MSDILVIKTPDWELVVWTKSISRQQTQLAQTLAARGKILPSSTVGFSTACVVDEVVDQGVAYCPWPRYTDELVLSEPLFFENTLVEFEFVFKGQSKGQSIGKSTDKVIADIPPQVRHKLQKVNESFHFSNRHGMAVLRGSINFANDIGWFRLPVSYVRLMANEGKSGEKMVAQTIQMTLSFEVFALKLDMAGDLDAMYRAIDRHYPLWRFALAQTTEQGFDRSEQSNSSFPLLWLAQFESLHHSLVKAIKLIVNSPHSRLLSDTHALRAHRLKGQVPPRLAEQVRENLRQGFSDRHYRVQQKKLSVDTPENRFIKMVLQRAHDNLARFAVMAKRQASGQQKLSAAFYQQLNAWQQGLDKYRNHALFKEVGQFHGLSKESLVLQQRSGYANVYRIWQLLSRYLEVLGDEASISTKSVAELYEVWCFLHIKQLILGLGFVEVANDNAPLVSRGLELRTEDGFRGAFEFRRDDGIHIRLAHEPMFDQQTHPVHSSITRQKPDILLEANFDNGDSLLWLFDAKYRLAKKTVEDSRDRVPGDAINQMHRYRDALLHLYKEPHHRQLSRPVFGGFALYPGLFAGQNAANTADNPYFDSIQLGIGAFPLLPSQQQADNWLNVFLTDKFGKVEKPVTMAGDANYKENVYASSDTQYINDDAARIPPLGMQSRRYRDLCLVVTGAEDTREAGYYESFEDGTAKWFHMRVSAAERAKMEFRAIDELSYCAIAMRGPGANKGADERKVQWIWPVVKVVVQQRYKLGSPQVGKTSEADELYWLFRLGTPERLSHAITGFAAGHHHMKLTQKATLTGVTDFAAVEEVYSLLSYKPD